MSEIETLASVLHSQVPNMQVTNAVEILRDYPVDGVLPRLMVTPATVEEAAQVVALTHQHGLTLLARGGGSQMNLGGPAEQVDVLLSTDRLTRLLEHEAPDLTCHVEAGIMLATLQAHLKAKGQRLALDPPNAEQASLGGLLATNASGPQRLRYGTARDLVIGMRVVQANGELARSGGRVVKNVAGYDLNKLYIGSLGTLGVIVEANFKLHPLPAVEQTLLLTYTNAADAMQTVLSIMASPLIPSALELIDPIATSDIVDSSSLSLPGNGYILAIQFEGDRTAVTRQLDEVQRLARRHNAVLGDDLTGKAQTYFWHVVRKQTQGTVTCKVALLPSQIVSYMQQVEHICRQHTLEAAIVAHAGNGVLYIELRPGNATPRLVDAIAALRRQAQETRGNMIVEHCPVDLKRRISVWGEPGADFHMMQQLKQRFDPTGTFVKGRFLGGL